MTSFSIVLSSNKQDKFYEAIVFAAAARAEGKNVILFLRGAALKAFLEGRWNPPDDESVAQGLARNPNVSPEGILSEIRSSGKTRIYACSAWVRMFNLSNESVARSVDAVIGLNAFLTQAADGPILYI